MGQAAVATVKRPAAGDATARPAVHEKTAAEVRRGLLLRVRTHLRREDPWSAIQALRRLAKIAPDAATDRDLQVGLARTFLMLGQARPALAHVRKAAKLPGAESLTALRLSILLRAARFDRALELSTAAVAASKNPEAELLAVHASALFRVQRTREAAGFYQRVLGKDPLHAEAHVRLGSGLSPPRKVVVIPEILAGVTASRQGRLNDASAEFQKALKVSPGHPIAHRLLGETLLQLHMSDTMASSSAEFQKLAAAVPLPDVRKLPLREFLPAYPRLAAPRQAVVVRAVSMFERYLPRLLAMGARHDLLGPAERTTDQRARAGLRGKRTFDGRVWDDVRGVGGLVAATGIEALDEAWAFGFDTLAHEMAHQAHLYAFKQVWRLRIRHLYHAAKLDGRCLDFYAASNEAEYFGQGVEAFVSLAKRPGCQKTHGHTRFELYRVDPALYKLIQGLSGFDPLRNPKHRHKLLPLCGEVAIVSGRPRDALVAAEMMPAGPARRLLAQRARAACKVLGLPGKSQ